MKAFIFFSFFLSLQVYGGGLIIGSGGDLVQCKPGAQNQLFGLYSLDYLVFQSSTGPQPLEVSSWEQSLFMIRTEIARKIPQILSDFDSFSQDVFNRELNRPHIWEPTDFDLVEIKDEDLPIAVKLPANCRGSSGEVQLIQAVIRQNREFSGGEPIVYKYMPEAFEKVKNQNPLQLSFLLVHEWLWSLSDNVDRNRRINWYLHSQEFREDSPERVQEKLRSLGLNLSERPRVVDSSGKGDFVSLQQAVQETPPGRMIMIRKGKYSLSGTVLNKPITLRGEGDAHDIVIEGSSTHPAVEIRAEKGEDILFENLTIQREANRERESVVDASILVYSGRATFRDCVLGWEDKK
ncbi:MAG: hypothetical protein KDD22_05655, partial [Bdellovibrionales bacterium]|nr:hypothetical protein [Bdellovibrionales bacterium]